MRALLLYKLCVLFMVPVGLLSQNYEMAWGDPIEIDGPGKWYEKQAEIIAHNSDFYFVLETNFKAKRLLQFDYDHQFVRELDLTQVLNGADFTFRSSLLSTASRDFFLISEDVSHAQYIKTYLLPMADNELKTPIDLAQTENKGLLTDYAPFDKFSLIDVSQNGAYVAICQGYSSRNGKASSYKVTLLDAELNEVWHDFIEIEELEAFQMSQLIVNDDGVVFLLSDYRIDQKGVARKERSRIPRRQIIISWPTGEQSRHQHDIELEDNQVAVEVSLIPGMHPQELIITGFYRLDEKRPTIQAGVFHQTYHPSDHKVSNTIILPHEKSGLGEVLLTNVVGTQVNTNFFMRRISSGNPYYDNFTIRSVLSFEDGSHGFLAESILLFQTGGPTSSAGVTSTDVTYIAGRFLLVLFSPDGKDQLAYVVTRDLSTDDRSYTGSANLITPDGLTMIYLDQKSKAEIEAQEQEGKAMEQLTTDLHFLSFADGKSETISLVSDKKDLFFNPSFSQKTDRGFLVLMVQKNKKYYQVGFLSLE